jgi:hypothetical protein
VVTKERVARLRRALERRMDRLDLRQRLKQVFGREMRAGADAGRAEREVLAAVRRDELRE